MTHRHASFVFAALSCAACATPVSTGAGSAPSPAVQEVLARAAAAQPVAATTPPPTVPAPPPVARNIDPVGNWSISLVAGGNPITVNAKIEKKADGTFGGTVTSDVTPPLPINWVKVVGKSMKMSVTGPDGTEALLDLVVEGDELSGDWAMGADGSKVSGKRVP